MAGREGGLAGAVGASVPDKDFVKNYICDTHEYDRYGGPTEPGVDFFERFASEPLIEP